MPSRDDDVKDVYQQETRSPKRPVDIETRRQRAKIAKSLIRLKEKGASDEDVLAFIVSELKLRRDDPNVLAALRIWREEL
jgi:hypothetical protein